MILFIEELRIHDEIPFPNLLCTCGLGMDNIITHSESTDLHVYEGLCS